METFFEKYEDRESTTSMEGDVALFERARINLAETTTRCISVGFAWGDSRPTYDVGAVITFGRNGGVGYRVTVKWHHSTGAARAVLDRRIQEEVLPLVKVVRASEGSNVILGLFLDPPMEKLTAQNFGRRPVVENWPQKYTIN